MPGIKRNGKKRAEPIKLKRAPKNSPSSIGPKRARISGADHNATYPLTPQISVVELSSDSSGGESDESLFSPIRSFCDITISPLENGKVELVYSVENPDFSEGSGKQFYSEYERIVFERFPREPSQRFPRIPLKKEVSIRTSHRGIVVNVFGLYDNIRTIISLLRGLCISSLALDSYLMLTLESHPKFVVLPSIFLHGGRSELVKDLKPEMDFFPEEDLQDKVVIAPICRSRHVYLSVFDFPKKKCQVFDSSWLHIPMKERREHLNLLLKILISKNVPSNLSSTKPWKFNFVRGCVQQEDSVSCGVFTVFFAENIVRGKPTDNKKQYRMNKEVVKQIRQKMAIKLIETTAIGQRVLRAISY